MQAARRALNNSSAVQPPPWTPANLGDIVWTRPTGTIQAHPVVTWESLVGTTEAARQAAAPNTPTLLTYAFLTGVGTGVSGGVILSLPKGIFEGENGWTHGFVNDAMIGLGQGYATGIAGLVGAGCRSTPGVSGAQTTLRMQGTAPASTLPQGNLITANGITGAYFAGFNLVGTQTQGDGIYNAGLVIAYCTNPIVERMTFIGVSPGYDSKPAGETFQVNFFRSNSALIQDCELDGRDTSGTPTCASWGWNTADDAVVKRVWLHDNVVGMLTFWETVNIYTEDYWVDRAGYVTTGVSGAAAGINHEQSEGTILHMRPHLHMVGGRTGTTRAGKHISMHSVHADVGANLQVLEPDFEPIPTSSTGMLVVSSLVMYHPGSPGRYNMTDYATRYGYQYMFTDPTIIKNGVSLICSPQYVGTVAQPGGWNSKDPTVYYAKSNG